MLGILHDAYPSDAKGKPKKKIKKRENTRKKFLKRKDVWEYGFQYRIKMMEVLEEGQELILKHKSDFCSGAMFSQISY